MVNSYIEINGAQYPLVIRSGVHTGLKPVQGFTMTANQVANFTIDFTLEQSITAPPGLISGGGTQDYILKLALRLINNVHAGTIGGTVALSTLQSNSACLAGYSVSGPLPNAQVDMFSGTITPSSSPTSVVEREIALSSSGSLYLRPAVPARRRLYGGDGVLKHLEHRHEHRDVHTGRWYGCDRDGQSNNGG